MNEKVLGLVSGVRDGKQLLVTTPKRCSATTAGNLYLGLVSGVRDGKPLLVVSDFVCDAGALAVGQTYLGLVSGIRDGKPLLVVPCGDCGGVVSCECTICCTLAATVTIGDGTPVDVDMTCGGTMVSSGGHCCVNDLVEDDIICFAFDAFYDEKNTIGTPEAWDYVTSSGTREVKTDIWSVEFASGGDTYRLSYWRNEGTSYQTFPTTVTTPFCYAGWSLYKRVAVEGYGSAWYPVAGSKIAAYVSGSISSDGVNPRAWMFDITNNSPYDPDDCPEGYSYASGELDISLNLCEDADGNPSHTWVTSYTVQDDCPVAYNFASYWHLNTDPDEEAYRNYCARVEFADTC